jgi:uncharacterized protein (UPF0147 family)
MPWTPDDGPKRHTRKANTPKKRRRWADVANNVLERTGDEGRAVRAANAVVARHEFSADQERSMRHKRR